MQDTGYRDFQMKLIPTAGPETMIGVRTPALRKYAKALIKAGQAVEFLKNLPHTYFDENQLHAFILSELKDYDLCIEETDRFLPYVDNWATCDQLSPGVFKKNHARLSEKIPEWISPAYPETVAGIRSEEYYVNMMIAWYFATALAKQYDTVLPYLEQRRLDPWTHNKTIQKAVESYRITSEQKEYLKSLKIKKSR